MQSRVKQFFLILLAMFGMAMLWSCDTTTIEGDQYLTWNLNQAYKVYDTVSIKLVDSKDTTLVYEVVWNDKIPDPANFPKYKLTVAKNKDFKIQIRCYNAKHELLLSKDVEVVGAKPKTITQLLPDTRILDLTVSPGTLTPVFNPSLTAYQVQVDSTVSSIVLTAKAIDAENVLTIDQKVGAWGQGISYSLHLGANIIDITVMSKDGKVSRSYGLIVTRGREITEDEIVSVALEDKSVTLYTGDGATGLKATVVPPGALLTWTSLDNTVVSVDAYGKLSPVGAGSSKVIVKAGKLADTIEVTVKKDAPLIDVGQNIGIKPGAEVVFNITLTQEHGTFVSFKYDLDGDGAWDNLIDTSSAPATLTLKHTYASAGEFIAHFLIRDSEGNSTPASRTITVNNSKYQVIIISPSRDTTVKTSPILILYEVNGTRLEKSVDLKEGAFSVSIDTGTGSEKGSATVKVTLDTKGPPAPLVSGPATTLELKPTWTWVSGGSDGIGIFRFATDSAGLTVAISGATKFYTPSANLIPGEHKLYVQERDSIGNWSLAGQAKVTILAPDKTPPNPPIVNATSPTNDVPKWTWATGGGGAGFYKSKLGDSTLAGATEGNATAFSLAESPVNGKVYTLWVAERDSVGNWSASKAKPVTFDATKPTVTIVAPQSSDTYITTKSIVTVSGTAKGPNPIVKVSYKVNNVFAGDVSFVDPNWTISGVTLIEGAPFLITMVATDNLGNTGEASLELKRDNTIPAPPVITTNPASPTKVNVGGWAWGPGSDNTNGSGLNGNYRYSLDGTNYIETAAAMVNDLTLKEGSTTFYLQEQDRAGNWSTSATKLVIADFTGPAVNISSPAPNAKLSSIRVTLSGAVSDALTSAQSVIAAGPLGSSVAVVTGANWITGELVLRSGLDTIIVTATDAVGNATKANLIVTVDVALTPIDIVYPLEGSFYNQDTITVRYKVNGGAEQGKLFTLTTEGSIPLEVQSTPNEAGIATKKSVNIFRDKTLPNAPTIVPAGRTFTKVDPVWTFTTGGDNTGGSGIASNWNFKITGSATNTGSLVNPSFTLAGATEGTYNFQVQQQDKAGNWGPYSLISTAVVDKTAPTVTVTSPANGLITSATSLTLSCNVVGAIAIPPISKILSPGLNTLTCTQSDSAGNSGSQSVNVYSIPNTVFVKSGATGTGVSWTDAAGNLESVIKAAKTGTQVWVAGGVYTATNVDSGFILHTGVSLYGGFSPNGTAKALTDRVYAKADTVYLYNPSSVGSVVSVLGTAAVGIANVTLNGLQVVINGDQNGLDLNYGTNITLRKIKFLASSDPTFAGINANVTGFVADSCTFTSFSTANYTIRAYSTNSAQTISISNSIITGNTWYGGTAVYIYNYGKTTLTNVWFMDSYTPFNGIVHLQYVNTNGEIDFKDCVFRASGQSDAIDIGSATRVITTTVFTLTPPSPPAF
jgi:hypothetical protein